METGPSTAQPSIQRFGHRHAGLPPGVRLGRPEIGETEGRVVGHVLHLRAGLHHRVRECVEPLPSGGAHRIEAGALRAARREIHRVVDHVAEEPRVDVHAREAGEVVLHPLRVVEQGDLAVLLLHLRGGRLIAVGGDARDHHAGRACAPSGPARRRPVAAGGESPLRRLPAAGATAAIGILPRLEERSNRPRASRHPLEARLLGQALRERLFTRRQHRAGRCQTGCRRSEKSAPIDVVRVVAAVAHGCLL
jgi:hypothetical protein